MGVHISKDKLNREVILWVFKDKEEMFNHRADRFSREADQYVREGKTEKAEWAKEQEFENREKLINIRARWLVISWRVSVGKWNAYLIKTRNMYDTISYLTKKKMKLRVNS